MARLSPGAQVGRWQVTGLIGAGDIAEAYQVRDGGGAIALLKLFQLDMSRVQGAFGAFERESQAFAQACGPMAASNYEFGVHAASGSAYVVRERIALGSLYDEVLRSGPLAAPRVVAILQALAVGLDAAHAQGLAHRGLKPQNLFAAQAQLSEPVSVRITDSSTHILRGAVPSALGWAGTPGWLAPDAADPSAASSARMDVYALGLVAFFLLTGRPVFLALSRPTLDYNALWAEMIEPLASASQRARELGGTLGSVLDPWFAQALAPHPRTRFASVGEMAAQLASRAGSPPVAPPRAPPPQQRVVAGRASTSLGLGPLPGLGSTVLIDKKTQPVGTPAAATAPAQNPAAAAGDGRVLGGTLIMDFSPGPPPAQPPPAPAGERAPGAPSKLAGTLAIDASQAPPGFTSEQGPVVLASGQPLAFMHELPRPAATAIAPPPVPLPAEPSASLSVPPPPKRSLLLPLVLLGVAGLIILGVIAAWALHRNSDSANEAALASASASAVANTATPSAAAPATPELPASTEPAPSAQPAEKPPELWLALRCEPACDRVECDGTVVEMSAEGVRLRPGKHVCRLERNGFLRKTETVVVAQGRNEPRIVRLIAEPQRASSTVERNPATRPPSKKQPCGTFINPCK